MQYKRRKKYLEIQDDIIKKYNIELCNGEKCQNDWDNHDNWSRTHAHVKERRICKWKRANSIQSTFTLFHEIGHIETTKSSMRRAEAEWNATIWAISKCKEYCLDVPKTIIKAYQNYIDRVEIEDLDTAIWSS